MKTNLCRFTTLFFFLLMLSISSLQAQDPHRLIRSSAESIASISEWCSGEAKPKTTSFETKAPPFSCLESSSSYQKWFRFTATTSRIEVMLRSGGRYGTLRFPYLVLYDDQFRSLTCSSYLDETGSLPMSYLGLEPGKEYFLAVLNHNKSDYQGSFYLCLNDEIGNDFVEGAVDLADVYHWCSEPEAFSTADATPDGPSASCLPKGPNFNRWFSFTAVSDFVQIEVQTGSQKGSAQFPYLTLFDASMKEVACASYRVEEQGTWLKTKGLIPGKKYFFSVDHQYNFKYPGTFTLCVNASASGKNEKPIAYIVGKLVQDNGKPVANRSIQLLSREWDVLDNTTTAADGRFSFSQLDPSDDFLVKIQGQNIAALNVSILMLDGQNKILKQTIRIDQGIYGFQELEPYYDNISLLDRKRLNLATEPGKHGIIGKAVDKNHPEDGVVLDVFLFANPNEQVAKTKSDLNGQFTFLNLPAENTFLIKFGPSKIPIYSEMFRVNDKGEAVMGTTSRGMSKDGFFHFQKLPPLEVSMELDEEQDVPLQQTDFSKIKEGKAITLKNIHFKYGEHQLLERSFTELGVLVEILEKNPNLRIEVSGHSDNLGSEAVNQQLSEQRARTVVNYLVAHGVTTDRLTFAGYGGSRPIAPNDTEEGRQANRRVEFKVIQ